MVKELSYEDVKHLERKLMNCSKLDILAEVAMIASKFYYQENNKRKSPSPSLDFLASCDDDETQLPPKKRSLKNISLCSEPEKRKEWVLEKPINFTEKNNTNCSSTGTKLKFKYQERATTSSGSEILANGQPRVDVNNQERATTSSGLQILANGRPQVDDNNNQGDNAPLLLSGLPEYLRRRVLELGGGRQVFECILVVEKKLYMSDVNEQQSRFLIPHGQMSEFLRGYEKRTLPLHFQIIEPLCYVHERTDTVVLTQWKTSLVLRETWNGIVVRNHLHQHSIVQLWAVRYDDGELVFVLVDLSGGEFESVGCSTGFRGKQW